MCLKFFISGLMLAAGALGSAMMALALMHLAPAAMALDLTSDQAVFIDAHSYIRHVRNTSGSAQFISTKTLAEWQSAMANPPTGTVFTPACRQMNATLCSVSRSVPYARVGEVVTVSAGYSKVARYTCVSGAAGLGASADTSWALNASGQCDAPAPTTCPAATLSWVGDARCGDAVPESAIGATFQLTHRSAKNAGKATATCRLTNGAPTWALTNTICSHDGND